MLSYDATPPLSVPLRFFLTAPAFGIAAGLLLAWLGGDAFVSRWTPGSLALTHLVALGVLTMTMFGALTQMLPVVAGAPMPQPVRVAGLVHPALSIGTAALAAGFAWQSAWAFRIAVIALSLAITVFALAAAVALVRSADRGATARALRFAAVALVVTAGTGIAFATAFGWGLTPPTLDAVAQHVLWALAGWVGLLVAGVAFQVVPMFQLTPPFDSRLARWMPLVVFLAIVLASLLFVLVRPWAAVADIPIAVAVTGSLVLFVTAVLRLQAQRRRRIPSPLVFFWRIALASALGGALLWVALTVFPGLGGEPQLALVVGVLLLAGFACSVVTGMLYKIVPFLAFLHLQQLRPPRGSVPNMKEVLSDADAYRQGWLHLLALALLVVAALWPEAPGLASAAGLAFAASSAALLVNLLRIRDRYHSSRRSVEALLAADPAAARPRGRSEDHSVR